MAEPARSIESFAQTGEAEAVRQHVAAPDQENTPLEREEMPPAPERGIDGDPRIGARAEILSACRLWARNHPYRTKRAAHEAFAHAYNQGLVSVSDETRRLEGTVSRPKIDRWEKAVRDGGTGNLKPKGNGGHGGARGVPIKGELRELFIALTDGNARHVTAEHLIDVAVARGHGVPHLRTVQRWLARRIEKEKARHAAINDPDGFKNRFMPAVGSRSENVVELNQRWELDSTLADVICSDGKRYALLVCIDIWSRRWRAVLAETSNAMDIAGTLLYRCLTELGVPGIVTTDNGKDYVSNHLDRVFIDLGIEHDLTAPFSPEQKPFVERVIGTITRGLFAHLPGFIGHNVADRKAIEARQAMGKRARRHLFRMALSVDQLQDALDAFALKYEHREHSSLGCSPFEKAASWTGERRVADKAGLRILLTPPPQGEPYRDVGKKGIRCKPRGLDTREPVWYWHDALATRVGQRVEVRCDPVEAGLLHVFELEGRGDFICTAENHWLLGKSMPKTAVQAQRAARKMAAEYRAEQRALERKHRTGEAMQDVLEHAKETAAKVVPIREADQVKMVATEVAKAADSAESAAAAERRKEMLERRWKREDQQAAANAMSEDELVQEMANVIKDSPAFRDAEGRREEREARFPELWGDAFWTDPPLEVTWQPTRRLDEAMDKLYGMGRPGQTRADFKTDDAYQRYLDVELPAWIDRHGQRA